jgi:hypothetical protein
MITKSNSSDFGCWQLDGKSRKSSGGRCLGDWSSSNLVAAKGMVNIWLVAAVVSSEAAVVTWAIVNWINW